MGWIHTVLEVYPKPLRGDFPTEGEPADWIEQKTVFFSQGDDETVILEVPLWLIFWIKLKQCGRTIYAWVFNNIYVHTPWGKKHMRRVDAFFAAIPVVGDEELREIMGDEEFEAIGETLGP